MRPGNPGCPDDRRENLCDEERARGYIYLHRRLRDHPYWQDAARLKVWLHILFSARFRTIRTLWDGHRMTVPRGSFLTSASILARELRHSRKWITKFLHDAERDGEILWDRRPGRKWGMITVVHYDDYQTPGTAEAPAEAPAEGQQRDSRGTTKEGRLSKDDQGQGMKKQLSGSYPAEGVGRVFEAFKKATGKIRPPYAWEHVKIEAAIAENAGDWKPIAAFVGDVTAAAVADGQPIKWVTYALAAWAKKQEGRGKKASVGGQPPYYRPAKPPGRTRHADESKHGAELVGQLLGRLGFGKKKEGGS